MDAIIEEKNHKKNYLVLKEKYVATWLTSNKSKKV
jgi:hypothetical protein